MIRCLAVDDEKWALDLLADNIRHVPYLQLIRLCKNSREATEVLYAEDIDLIFLDVQMPGLNGLQFIQTLPDPPLVILVTAYQQYALEGFNLSVVDYLVKPVSLERFIKACNKAKDAVDLKKVKRNLQRETSDHIFVHADYSLVKVIFDEILYIEGLKDYVKIFLFSANKPLLTRMSLKALEDKLPPTFIRTHKSFIVSIPKVSSIKRDAICINDAEIPVGESYKESIATILSGRK